MGRFLRPYGGHLAAAGAALLLASATVLAFGQVLRQWVDRGFAAGSPAQLEQVLLLFLGVVALLAISVAGRAYLVTWIGERVVADVREAVFRRVLALEPAFFEATRTGEVITRLTADTSLLQVVVGATLPVALRNTLLISGGLILMALTSPKLTLLTLAGVPLVLIPIWLLGYQVRRLSRQTQDRVADVGSHVDEVLHAIRTVQAFCHEAIDHLRYKQHVEAVFSSSVARSRVSALLAGSVIMLIFSAVGIVLWIGGKGVLAGTMSGGQLAAFLFYAVLVAGAMGALSEVAGSLLRAAGAAERLLELLATEPRIASPSTPLTLPAPQGALSFESVIFAYPSRAESPALVDFTLDVKPGEKVALVGPSGAGKSTLFQLLLRFYDPDSGSIRLDGVDLRAANLAELRGRIALVPQEPVIFAADVWENIRYGLEVDEESVRSAARAAHADEFVQELPEGYATFLGERGVRLSGGQRQRIAIARAILRDPALLLLDEATSALDAESERLVQEALEHLMRGRTTLIIAHRLATVRKADRIVVLERGAIVDIGSHDQLVQNEGLYARLAALQFRNSDWE